MKRLIGLAAPLLVVVLFSPGCNPNNGQTGFWTGEWVENMGPNIFLTEGAKSGNSYLVSGFWGTGSARCTVSGFTEEGNYWHLNANYRCGGGSERGHFSVFLSQTRPHDRWAGPCQQDVPSVVKHGTMTGVRV